MQKKVGGKRTVAAALILATGVLVAAAASAHAAGEYEANDSITEAAGPLQGGKNYTAGQETANDVDWYRFYVADRTQLDVTGTTLGDGHYCDADLHNRNGRQLWGMAMYFNGFEHINYTLKQPGVYYLEFWCEDIGDRYRFKLEPASSIVGQACGSAHESAFDAEKQLAKLNKKIARKQARRRAARGRKAKRRIKAQIKVLKKDRRQVESQLAAAEAQAGASC